ncbi:MAG TPA: hypothetical protein VJB66_01235 [Candidatus Nanoarchaeia archaeon]|nr:hypothetical protein [Candidatus Nanoarchaeia archaeon]
MNFGKNLSIFAQIVAYIIAIVVLIQILNAIFGGTWEIEEIILALLVFNLTVTFSLGGAIINLNNKISHVDKRMHAHFEWHRGRNK